MSDSPFDRPNGNALLLASAPGHVAAISGWYGMPIVGGERVKKFAERVLPFSLSRAAVDAVRAIGVDGEPLAGLPVDFTTQAKISMGQRSWTSIPLSFRLTTDADGTVAIDIPPGLGTYALNVPAEQAGGKDARPPALRPHVRGEDVHLDFTDLGRVTVSCSDSSGQPARNALALMVPVREGGAASERLDASAYRFRLDKSGRATIPAQAGRWLVLVTNRRELTLRAIAVANGQSSTAEVVLKPLPVISGEVLLGSGVAPVPVHMRINGSSSNHTDDDVVLALRGLGQDVNLWLCNDVRLAADGTFSLPYLAVPDTTYTGVLSCGGVTRMIKLTSDQGPIEIDLRE